MRQETREQLDAVLDYPRPRQVLIIVTLVMTRYLVLGWAEILRNAIAWSNNDGCRFVWSGQRRIE
jgi:hypothetical protein